MNYTIKSRKLAREVTFSIPGEGYIFVDLNGKPGTLGEQICEGGRLTGSTIAYRGDDELVFQVICDRWFKAYVAEAEPTPEYYMMETQASGCPDYGQWEPVHAESIDGAKRAAVRRQCFQGTTLWLANRHEQIIAVRRADALDMSYKPEWQEY
jgi:hypothetical protein